jgi:hypothetical protein
MRRRVLCRLAAQIHAGPGAYAHQPFALQATVCGGSRLPVDVLGVRDVADARQTFTGLPVTQEKTRYNAITKLIHYDRAGDLRTRHERTSGCEWSLWGATPAGSKKQSMNRLKA